MCGRSRVVTTGPAAARNLGFVRRKKYGPAAADAVVGIVEVSRASVTPLVMHLVDTLARSRPHSRRDRELNRLAWDTLAPQAGNFAHFETVVAERAFLRQAHVFRVVRRRRAGR